MSLGFTAYQFSLYILTDCIALFFLLVIGHFITSIVLPEIANKKTYLSAFVKLFSGILTVTFIYAQIKSAFPTVLLFGYPVLIFFLIYRFTVDRQRILTLSLFNRNDLKMGLIADAWKKVILICLSISATFAVLLLINSDTGFFRVPHYDFVTYGNISSALNISGRENTFYQSFLFNGYDIEKVNSLYHYPELWFNSLIIFFTGKSSVLTSFFVTFPILLTGAIAGILSLYENYATVNTRVIVAVILLLNMSGIYLPVFNKLEFMRYFESICFTNIISSPKYSFSVMVFTASALAFFNNRLIYSLLLLLILPICNVGHFPGVIGGALVFITVLYFLKPPQVSRKDLLLVLLFYLIFSVLFFLYIKLFCNSLSNNPSASNLITDLLNSEYPWKVFKVYLGDITSILTRTVVVYMPVAVLASVILIFNLSLVRLYNKHHLLWMTLMFVVLLTGSFSAFFVNNNVPDPAQLFYNNLPFLNISIIILFLPLLFRLSSFNNTSKVVFASVAVFIIFSLTKVIPLRYYDSNTKTYNEYSPDYVSEVFANINPLKNKMGVFWSAKGSYERLPYLQAMYLRPVFFLSLNDPYTDVVEMDHHYSFTNVSNTFLDTFYIDHTPFMMYLKQKRAINDSLTIQELQYTFIKENLISYGFADGLENIPDKIKRKVTYILQDPNTRKYFIRFNLTE